MAPGANMLRLSGIVLHASGAPGETKAWSMAGITCLIAENDTGSLALPDALPERITLGAHAERVALKKADRVAYVYKPGAPLTKVVTGLIHRLDFVPHQAKAAPGKASRVLINPVGEWNKLECICAGDRITIILNGTVVNVATRVSQTSGQDLHRVARRGNLVPYDRSKAGVVIGEVVQPAAATRSI